MACTSLIVGRPDECDNMQREVRQRPFVPRACPAEGPTGLVPAICRPSATAVVSFLRFQISPVAILAPVTALPMARLGGSRLSDSAASIWFLDLGEFGRKFQAILRPKAMPCHS